MKLSTILLFCGAAAAVSCSTAGKQERRFPDDFIFGASTAAYQIEGAWNADDKGENIWDHLTHNYPEAIADFSSGDIAADSYNFYKRDIEMIRELGLDVYRFSISWARILPNGFANYVSESGVEYYNNLIDEMLKYNIEPMVTLYHWDLPQKLQELGGFANSLLAEWFEDYARVVYRSFGDRVKYWITFNEPYQICNEGYASITKAPRLNMSDVGDYLCARSLLLAHARAYHAYNNDYKPLQGGQCGFTIAMSSFVPLTDSEEDMFSIEILRQFESAIYTDPIYSKNGGFPKELVKLVELKSAKLGYPRSLLQDLTVEEAELVRGTYDFYGINHYGGSYISAADGTNKENLTISIEYYAPDDWPQAASTWLRQMPDSIAIVLESVQNRYGDVPVFITENGWSTRGGLVDDDRVAYFRAALDSALNSLDAGINLKGYVAWSLMDNFEWMEGYTERFGLYEVDFDDPARPRTPRKSAFVYKNIVSTRTVDYSYEPDASEMTIDPGH